MENKELKIEVPDGYEIDRKNSTFERIIFKKVDNLPQRWEDLKTINGFYVASLSSIYKAKNNVPSIESCRNVFPTKEEAEACLALAQLCQLRDRYNDGWKPDWNNGKEYKYSIVINKGRPFEDIYFNIQKVLSFKTEELRDEFLENFRNLIEIAKPLL